MKTKKICELTGLSRKALLFYEEKGLFRPEKRWSNGREYREYSEENLRELREIATLRKAWFTIDEIRRMKERPEETPEIFRSYYLWLQAQQAELAELLRAAEDLRRTGVADMAQLVQRLEQPARSLPLPPSDIHPRFRYLDEMEERPPRVQIQTNLTEDGGNAGFWHLAMERRGGIKPVSYDDMFRGLGFDDYQTELENGTVASKEERDPKWIWILKGIFTGIAAFSGFMIILNWFGSPRMQIDYGGYWPWTWTWTCVISGLIRGALEFFTWRSQNKKWLAEEGKKQKPNIRG